MRSSSNSFYFRPEHETLVEMEVAVRSEFSVDVCFIQCGYFFEAYNTSAEIAAAELDYTVTTNAQGIPMSGFPVVGLQTLIDRMERLGLSFAIVEQMGDSRRGGRKLRAVTHVFPEPQTNSARKAEVRHEPRTRPTPQPERPIQVPPPAGEHRVGPLRQARVLESHDGTIIVSPDGEILDRIPAGTTTSIDWYLREATKRLNYPRHGARWDDPEDELLRARATSGLGVSQLARLHQRAPGGIRARLKKLGLQD